MFPWIYQFSVVCILLGMGMTLYCAVTRELLYDKILSVNVFGTITVLFISMHGFMQGRPDFLDIALVYAMINFIATIAILKFFEYRDMARGSYDDEI